MSDKVDALVIFGATGDLAKLETFPALVGLVERGVLDVPVVGVAKSGWGLEQFRDYATASLKLNKMDPSTPAATKMLSLLRMWTATWVMRPLMRRCLRRQVRVSSCCSIWRCRRFCSGGSLRASLRLAGRPAPG